MNAPAAELRGIRPGEIEKCFGKFQKQDRRCNDMRRNDPKAAPKRKEDHNGLKPSIFK